MKRFPSYIVADGKSGVFDDAFGLEDSGESSKGGCADYGKGRMGGRKGCTKTVYPGGDLCHAGQKGAGGQRKQGKRLDPLGQNGKQHNITADDYHGFAGGGDGVF